MHLRSAYIYFNCQRFHCRDSLLATLLDAVRSCGNQDVHVRMSRTPRGKRVMPLSHPVDEETEANLLKLIIHDYQYPAKRFELLDKFNANIPHSGLNYSVTQDVSNIFYQIIQECFKFRINENTFTISEHICREQREIDIGCIASAHQK